MADAQDSYLAECFWPGVTDDDLRALDERIESCVPAGEVAYRGRLLVLDDEVVLVLFQGPIGAVRRVAERARVPFGRILRTVPALRPPRPPTEKETPQ